MATSAPRHLQRMLSLEDFEAAARRCLPRPLFGYLSGAAENGRTLSANRAAFDDVTFRPRALVDITQRHARTELFGTTYAAPFGIAPMGLGALMAYRGDVVMAQAAANAGVPMVLSGASLIALETVAQANPDIWFQAYLPGDEQAIAALIARLERAHIRTLVLTVDMPVAANREQSLRAGFSIPLRPSLSLAWQGVSHPQWLLRTFAKTLWRHGMPHFENTYAGRGGPMLSAATAREMANRGGLVWTHVALMRRLWKGTLVIKGILRADDARHVEDLGADGLIVSNHGGRQLDGTLSSLHALPAIVAAAHIPVMVDSGFRRGTDVLKALALGARFVFVGRPFAYAAAVAGEAGVAHAIALLQQEVLRNLAMLGATDIAALRAGDFLHPTHRAPGSAARDPLPFSGPSFHHLHETTP